MASPKPPKGHVYELMPNHSIANGQPKSYAREDESSAEAVT